jgi:short-subunit dehydrogenase
MYVALRRAAERRKEITMNNTAIETGKRIAVITGASSGMGREFVLALDREEKYDELWVIARRREKLEELAPLTRAKIRAIPLNLGSSEDIQYYKSMLEAEKPHVHTLVNAAGFGKFRAFTELTLEEQLAMIDLNDRALVSMTYITLPYMKKGDQIYQLGSLSSFQPVPYINVYGASKAFVLSFSRALNKEMQKQGRGIRVMAVCPGWVKTDFFDRAENEKSSGPKNKKPMLDCDYVVRCAMRAMKRRKMLCTCNWYTKMQHVLFKLVPDFILTKIWLGMLVHPKSEVEK